MADTVIKATPNGQLTTDWTINNTDSDPMMAAVAYGAQMSMWYGEQIKSLTSDVQTDLNKLDSANSLLANWDSPGFLDPSSIANSVLNNSPAAADQFAQLSSLGVDLSGADKAYVTWTPTTGSIGFFHATYVSQGAATSTGQSFPSDNVPVLLPGVPGGTTAPEYGHTNTLNEGQIYVTDDSPPITFIVQTDPSNPLGQNCWPVSRFQPIVSNPTQAQKDAWKQTLQSSVTDLTQMSQDKQSALQDLITQQGKFNDFETNIMERYETMMDAFTRNLN